LMTAAAVLIGRPIDHSALTTSETVRVFVGHRRIFGKAGVKQG
jgi:hypothetical protein